MFDQDVDNEEVMMLGSTEEVPSTPGIMKKVLWKMKRVRRCHKKCSKAVRDVQESNKLDEPLLSGTKPDNSPSTFKRLCSSCFQVMGKKETFIYEPP